MQDFRQQVAISIDGGGIKGLIVAKALEILEEHLDQSLHDTFRLTAGTSTGAIIAAGIAAGLTGKEMTSVYKELGPEIFRNPCFLAAYEINNCLKWEPGKTTLISLGTGRARHQLPPAARLWPWQWLKPLLGAFLESADKHQVHLVTNFFENLDFRRFQVELAEPIEMDDASPETLRKLEEYGEKLGNKILNDEIDPVEVEIEPLE